MSELDEVLKEIEQRERACLEGPWMQVCRDGKRLVVVDGEIEIPGDQWKPDGGTELVDVVVATVDPAHADDALIASFIANAREDVPRLLAALRKCREQRDDLLDEVASSDSQVLERRTLVDAALLCVLLGEVKS